MREIATVLCAFGILGLFVLERDREARTSRALWIPVAYVLIICSRAVSAWLGTAPTAERADIYLEGSPIDRLVFIVLFAAALTVLIGRREQVELLLRKNGPILLFFSYAALSIIWSDFPFVTFKHWTKGAGDVAMVLVVLTDIEPVTALKRLLTRTGFILIPLSFLFSKYYPDLGRTYSPGWVLEYTGVTTQKNQLGMICMIFGLGSLWCFLLAYRDREQTNRIRHLVAHGAMIGMVVWLLWLSNSMTSLACSIMAGGVMVVASRPSSGARPAFVHLLIAAVVGLSAFALFLNPGGGLVRTLGRDATLTGRTDLWHGILSVAGNPLVGTGYESFFLGPRLQDFWSIERGSLNGFQEAHNGYLEVYLNLGWVGVSLLAIVLTTGYRKVVRAFRQDSNVNGLSLAYFVAAIIYSFTEAGFRMQTPIWIFLLWAIIAASQAAFPEDVSPLEVDHRDDFLEYEPLANAPTWLSFCKGAR